jgi:hypothetical protein
MRVVWVSARVSSALTALLATSASSAQAQTRDVCGTYWATEYHPKIPPVGGSAFASFFNRNIQSILTDILSWATLKRPARQKPPASGGEALREPNERSNEVDPRQIRDSADLINVRVCWAPYINAW